MTTTDGKAKTQKAHYLRLLESGRASAAAPPKPKSSEMARALAAWYSSHKRQFPWRLEDDPFLILISEILLRKTQAQAVEDIYDPFFTTYSSSAALALSNVADIESALANLGLSTQRAAQLKAIGNELIAVHHGAIPNRAAALLELSGVGPYTASIVGSIIGDERVPAIDSNVSRVVMRLFAANPTHLEPRKSPNIWALAGNLLSGWPDSPSDFNWALLDLAGKVCTSRKPSCEDCPLSEYCEFAKSLQLEDR